MTLEISDCSTKSHKLWQGAIMVELGYTFATVPKHIEKKLVGAEAKLNLKNTKSVEVCGYTITKNWR